MNTSLGYRLSLGLTVVLTLIALLTLAAWLGVLVNGLGQLPLLALMPWKTLGLVALVGLNCTLRARVIVGRAPTAISE